MDLRGKKLHGILDKEWGNFVGLNLNPTMDADHGDWSFGTQRFI